VRVFLTGATGLIGSRVAALLAARGDSLSCLVRETSNTTALRAAGADLITADVSDPVALARGLDGADAAIHMAAIYQIGVVDATAMERVNVGATGAFLDAVAEAGTDHAVYTSSTAALGPAPAGQAEGDPDSDWRGPYPSVYHRTKADAHRLARAAAKAGTPVTVVSPAFGYGPGDTGPAGRFVHDLVRGRVPGLLIKPSTYSYVHADDIASGIVAALDHGPSTAHFVLGGEVATVNAFAERVARLAGSRPPPLRMPTWLALTTGALLDAVCGLTGASFTISRESIRVSAGLRWVHPYDRTTEVLGWVPRGLNEGLSDTLSAYG
jgi:nucleoside-diphosphate-sugar epimerase